ncbi:MAG: ABC transporter permease [Bacillota bacterium]
MILQAFRMAFSSILINKLRSFLTMLGIIIGVIAVVVLISLVNGATNSVTEQIQGLGSNLLIVNITKSQNQSLSVGELDAYVDTYDSISAIAPSLSKSATAKFGANTYDATIQGTTPTFEGISKLEVDSGRFLKMPDLNNHSAVAVIGVEVSDELFGDSSALGESITVDGQRLLIIGVLKDSDSMISGVDSKIIIPYTLAQRMYHQSSVTSFYAEAASSDEVYDAEDALDQALLIKYRQDDDSFSIINQSAILDAMDSIMGTLTLLLGGIAAISLLVGGIGIMNIMLVSVVERTKEIGIRKAIGASRKRILLQFLIESLVISVLGGLFGLALSFGLLELISMIADMSFGMSWDTVALAIGFSMFVGVVFGLYPANKASKLQPIEALRSE